LQLNSVNNSWKSLASREIARQLDFTSVALRNLPNPVPMPRNGDLEGCLSAPVICALTVDVPTEDGLLP
jgi:hypothetical protein